MKDVMTQRWLQEHRRKAVRRYKFRPGKYFSIVFQNVLKPRRKDLQGLQVHVMSNTAKLVANTLKTW